MEDLKAMKGSMSLDFGVPRKQRPATGMWTPSSALLASPDLKQFALSTPEIESLIGNAAATPTPAQQEYARPFEQALGQLQQQDWLEPSLPPPEIKAEPIDMADQERIKLERKRLRNRIAATKCRRNKLEKIAMLEDKVRQLRAENGELRMAVARSRDYVTHLKTVFVSHVSNGCSLPEV